MIEFYKYHALGNDYIVIDPQHAPDLLLTPERIRLICHRNFGVGSDGILYGPLFEDGQIRLRIFNPDGSEAEKSGNGIRIFSKYLVDAGYLSKNQFSLDTAGGRVAVELLNTQATLIRVNMGVVTFWSERIQVTGSPREVVNEPLSLPGGVFRVTCLSLGNPHCVVPLPNISKELACELGPSIENHPQFPKRINTQLVQVLDRHNIRIEIWERGAGYTLASGSSSSAAACAAYKLGLVDPELTVHMPGGTITIAILPDWHVLMSGSVSYVARGQLSAEFQSDINR